MHTIMSHRTVTISAGKLLCLLIDKQFHPRYSATRDEIVARAINDTTAFGVVTYEATSEDIFGLREPGVDFINHS